MSYATDPEARSAYQAIVDGERRDGERGRLLFCVSTDDLEKSRGDLYVGLGLARALNEAGWGVSLWPTPRLTEETPDDIDVAIVMIESFVPGMVHPNTKAIAWVRNWTEEWAALPYLTEFTQIWCSSNESAARMREVYAGPVHYVPLGTDVELFHAIPNTVRKPEVVSTANFWGVARGITEQLEQVAVRTKVTWFGANSRFLRLRGRINHRDAIDYFALPRVYSGFLVVVDDVIEAAARYGNQNSRIFDALACGAIVVTNTRNGLDDLGLGELPVYDGADELDALVRRLTADPSGTVALAARLQSVVVERHSYARRATEVRSLLELATAEDTDGSRRSQLLRWAAMQRETLRTVEAERSEWRTSYYDASDEIARLLEELRSIRESRSYKMASDVHRIAAGVRRRLRIAPR